VRVEEGTRPGTHPPCHHRACPGDLDQKGTAVPS
jgi:hypothetical protein